MFDERLLWLVAMAVSATGVLVASRQVDPPVVAAAMATAPLTEAPLLPVEGERVVVTRSEDGLFYVRGSVNGVPVRFLVDSGASALILAPADAERAGISPLPGEPAGELQTAAGASRMDWGSAKQLEIAGRNFSGVRAAMPARGLKVSLLGQDILRRLGAVTFDGDRLIIAATARRPRA